jgi:hypothetical protein
MASGIGRAQALNPAALHTADESGRSRAQPMIATRAHMEQFHGSSASTRGEASLRRRRRYFPSCVLAPAASSMRTIST